MKWDIIGLHTVLCVAVIIQLANSSAVVNYQTFISEKVRFLFNSLPLASQNIKRFKYDIVVLGIWNVILFSDLSYVYLFTAKHVSHTVAKCSAKCESFALKDTQKRIRHCRAEFFVIALPFYESLGLQQNDKNA